MLRQQRRKRPPGAARAGIVAAELLDELSVPANDSVSAFDLRLAKGNPLRRLLVGSKGRLSVVVAVHDGLLNQRVTAIKVRPTDDGRQSVFVQPFQQFAETAGPVEAPATPTTRNREYDADGCIIAAEECGVDSRSGQVQRVCLVE